MSALTITIRFDHSTERSVASFLSDPFEVDPSNEMFGDLAANLQIDFSNFDLDYANLYFVA